MKNKLVIVSLIVVVALCAAMPVLAQDELTLEGLSEQLSALVDSVTTLTERTDMVTARLDTIEGRWINPEPVSLVDGGCLVGSSGGMHDSSVLKYKEMFDEWPDTDQMDVVGVAFVASEDGSDSRTFIQYELPRPDQFIIEIWDGCEFLRSSDWWQGDWSEGPFEGLLVLPTE